MTWEEAIADPQLQGLPYKVELNEYGQVVMSPTRLIHGHHQFRIGELLSGLLPTGEVVTEAAVLTSKNVKVPDVVWFTAEQWERAKEESAATTAPAICVEVSSASNTDREFAGKRALYFEAGAREVWFCDLMGNMEFFDAAGPLARSAMCPEFPTEV